LLRREGLNVIAVVIETDVNHEDLMCRVYYLPCGQVYLTLRLGNETGGIRTTLPLVVVPLQDATTSALAAVPNGIDVATHRASVPEINLLDGRQL
jgi:hypothetical protein